MAQTAIADRERVLSELAQHRPHDARTREDDVGALGLEADDLATLVEAERAVQLDLPVDLGPVEHGALHDVRVVLSQTVLDRGEVRDRPAHRDEHIGRGSAVETSEVGIERGERLGQHLLGDDTAEAVPLRVADGAHIDAEPLLDLVSEART